MKSGEFLTKYLHSIIALGLALAIMWFVLNILHTKFPGTFGNIAGGVGARVSGQAYQFS